MKSLFIIGTGLAGYTVAREFRKLAAQAGLRIARGIVVDAYLQSSAQGIRLCRG